MKLALGLAVILVATTSAQEAKQSPQEVWSWGARSLSESEGLEHSPKKIGELADVVSLTAADTYTLALRKDGTVWMWGVDPADVADLRPLRRIAPKALPGLAGIRSVAADDSVMFIVKDDGTVWKRGRFHEEVPARGAEVDTRTPALVDGLSNIVSVAANNGMYLALDKDGGVWAWGNNPIRQLLPNDSGRMSTGSFEGPPRLPGPIGAVILSGAFGSPRRSTFPMPGQIGAFECPTLQRAPEGQRQYRST